MNATQVLKIFQLTLIKVFLLSRKTNLYKQNDEFEILINSVISKTIFMIRDIENETNTDKILESLRTHSDNLPQLNLTALSNAKTVPGFCLELLEAIFDYASQTALTW